MYRTLAPMLGFIGLAAIQTSAQDCAGEPGYVLDISPEQVAIGTAFEVTVQAPTGSLVLLFLASSPGFTPIPPFGTLCIGPPAGIFAFIMPAESVTFDHPIECKPEYAGVLGFFQFAANHPAQPAVVHFSNTESITIVDGDCTQGIEAGDFVSYTQGGWGQKCKGNNVGCVRDEHFATAFPNGLILGDPDGDDADSVFAIVLTSSKAVKAFLPAGKKPAILEQDHVDPDETEAGVFAGQLAAAKLNVGFDAAGSFDDKKKDPSKKLADAVFVANVDEDLFGMTVAEVIGLADAVISTALAVPIDIDGDGDEDVKVSDLSDALAALNEEFDGGNAALGSLDFPMP